MISFGLKGFSLLAGFLLISLYLNAVNQRAYGIILTITSIAGFISFFDIGIGNGLRNKLGRSIAENNKILSKKYISTAYAYVGYLFGAFLVIFLIIVPIIDWSFVLNVKKGSIPNLNLCFVYVVFLFAVRFILELISVILLADQKSSMNDSILFLTNLLNIVLFYLLKWAGHLNFYSILISICVAPVIILIIYSLVLFNGKYAAIKPSLKFVDHSLRKDLLGLGLQFFAIQIIYIIIFSTTNILIVQLFKIDNVAEYNIAFKYYNVSTMIFSILLTPIWGAFTNAWYQKEYDWIEKNIKKYILIAICLCFLSILQYYLYPIVSLYWLKKYFPIQFLLCLSLVIYNFIFCFTNIFSFFLNGIGQVRVQLYCAIAGGLVNIPLTIWLSKYTTLGLSSIVFANIFCLLPGSIFTSIETFKLLKNARLSQYSSVYPDS